MSDFLSGFNNKLASRFSKWTSREGDSSSRSSRQSRFISANNRGKDSVSFSGRLMDKGRGIGKSGGFANHAQETISATVDRLNTTKPGSLDNRQISDLKNVVKKVRLDIEQQSKTTSNGSLDKANQVLAEAEKDIAGLAEATTSQENIDSTLNQVSAIASSIADEVGAFLKSTNSSQGSSDSDSSNDTSSTVTTSETGSTGASTQPLTDKQVIEASMVAIDKSIETLNESKEKMSSKDKKEIDKQIKDLEKSKAHIQKDLDKGKDLDKVAKDAVKELKDLVKDQEKEIGESDKGHKHRSHGHHRGRGHGHAYGHHNRSESKVDSALKTSVSGLKSAIEDIESGSAAKVQTAESSSGMSDADRIKMAKDTIDKAIDTLSKAKDSRKTHLFDDIQLKIGMNALEKSKAKIEAGERSGQDLKQVADNAAKELESLASRGESFKNSRRTSSRVDAAVDSAIKDINASIKSMKSGQVESTSKTQETTEVQETAPSAGMSDEEAVEAAKAAIDKAIETLSESKNSRSTHFFDDIQLKIGIEALKKSKEKIEAGEKSGKDMKEVADKATKELESLLSKGEKFKASRVTSSRVDATLDKAMKDMSASISSIKSGRAEAAAAKDTPPAKDVDQGKETGETGSPQEANNLSKEDAQKILDEVDNIQKAIDSGNYDQAVKESTDSFKKIDDILKNSPDSNLVDSLKGKVSKALDLLKQAKDSGDSGDSGETGNTGTDPADIQDKIDGIKDKLTEAKELVDEAEVSINLTPDLLGEVNNRVASLRNINVENSVDKLDLSSIGKGLIDRTASLSGAKVNEDGSVSSVDQDSMLGAMGDRHSAQSAEAKVASRYKATQKAGVDKAGSATVGGDRIEIGGRSQVSEAAESRDTVEIQGEKGEKGGKGGKAIDMDAAMKRAGSRIKRDRAESTEAAKKKGKVDMEKAIKQAVTKEAETIISEGAESVKTELLNNATSVADRGAIAEATEHVLANKEIMSQVTEQAVNMIESGHSKEEVMAAVNENLQQHISSTADQITQGTFKPQEETKANGNGNAHGHEKAEEAKGNGNAHGHEKAEEAKAAKETKESDNDDDDGGDDDDKGTKGAGAGDDDQ